MYTKMVAIIALYFVLLIKSQSFSLEIPFVSDISEIISIARDAQDIANGNYPLKSLLQPTANPLVVAIEKIADITEQITDFSSTMDKELDNLLETILRRLPKQGKLDRRMETFNTYVRRIETIYDDLQFFSNKSANFNDRTLIDFVDTVTSLQYGSISDTLNAIKSLFITKEVPYSHEGIFNLLNKVNKESKPEDVCEEEQFQNRLIAIYSIIAMCELKSFIATSFAYKYVSEKYDVDVSAEMSKTEAQLVLRIEEYMLEIRNELKLISRDIYRCDPPVHILGETYTEFEGAFLSIVINANQAQSESKCDLSCPDINTENIRNWYKYMRTYLYTPSCYGRVLDCEIAPVTNTCEYAEDMPKFYKFVYNYENTYGKKSDACDRETQVLYKSLSASKAALCKTCICACYQDGGKVNGTYTFNLRPQLANIENNCVVTNVRFVRNNGMISIQVEESALLKKSITDDNSASWKPNENIEFEFNRSGGNFYLHSPENKITLENDVDYAYITDKQDILNLDELRAPPGYVITGVRLNQEIPGDKGSPIQLEIHVTSFDYKTGKLLQSDENSSIWITPQNNYFTSAEYESKKVKIEYGGNIYNDDSDEEIFHTITLAPNRYVRFSRSYVSSDAGQSTIPFFDIRPASIIAKTPLDGLSLIYREASKRPGFIAFKMHGLDTSESFYAAITKDDLKKYQGFYNTKFKYEPLVK